MDAEIYFWLGIHCVIVFLFFGMAWYMKRKKRKADIYRALFVLDAIIFILTTLGLAGVFGELKNTDGFVIVMYSLFAGLFLLLLSIIILFIQLILKRKV
jgi:hypothetical protein